MIISVREATIHDAEIISRLATRTFYETYSWYNTPENMRAYTEKHFNAEQTRQELQEPGTYFLLAYANEETVGYAKLRNLEHPPELKEKKYIEIERIYVDVRFQKHKVGYALFKQCLAKGQELGLDTIWLGVWEKNEKAIAFYERCGFKKFGTHNFQLGNDAQNDLLLQYDLH